MAPVQAPATIEAAGTHSGGPSLTEEERVAECLGVGLPPQAEEHLRLAGQNYHCDEVALAHLQAAWDLAPGHAAVYIGKYRFYFYKNRLPEALAVGTECLAKAAVDNGMSPDWRDAKPTDAEFSSFEAILPRFFLFTLKGYAYLQMRLGDVEEGRAAVLKLLELDPSDKVGAKVLLEVVQRIGRDDYE
jgi:tetratricopeptide (TPR) repeat protein